MDPRVGSEVSITDLFDKFIEASTMRNVLSIHHRILNYSDLSPCEFNKFFPRLKRAVTASRARTSWKAKALFSKIDKKAAHRCYANTKTTTTPLGNRLCDHNVNGNSNNSQDNLDDGVSPSQSYTNNNALQHYNCLVIGSGPAGLRTAIELQLLGANKVVVVEKRSRFSRNNVLHLWPFVIDDLKSLGAKKFYGKFCAGSIDHISIRQLQLILLKICLMIGCDFRDSCSYMYLCPSTIKQQQVANKTSKCSENNDANGYSDSTELDRRECDLDCPEVAGKYVNVSENMKPAGDSSCRKSEPDDKFDQPNDIVESAESLPLEDPANEPKNHQKQKVDENTCDETRSKNPKTAAETPNANIRTGENLHGTRAHFESEHKPQEVELHSYEWDIIIGADGRRNTLSKFFPRKEFRGRLAIAITANFINRQTPVETAVPEISGLSFIYNQDMFNALAHDKNIQLENICYYKDDTHYFVMTAKKKSLLERGVLLNDYATTQALLSDDNVDRQALLRYAKDAAYWTTGLEPLDFALNHYGQEDCAMFDFTSMYAASNACKALRTSRDGFTLVSLVGDSLLEPFWPTGSGCARGFLSSFDAAWMCRQWAINKCAVIDNHLTVSSRSSNNRSSTLNVSLTEPSTYNRMALAVMAERESIYRILAQTTSENLQQNYSHWTLNPHSRYPNLNRHLVTPSQVEHLISGYESSKSLSSPMSGSRKGSENESKARRVKSPNNSPGSRKVPKKLKSADASPLARPKSMRNRSKSLSRYLHNQDHQDIEIDDTCLEFEESYRNLSEEKAGVTQHLSYKRRSQCDNLDDIFIPSISGTFPSSNNLLSLEARRARDIDECLRQRRQKAKIHIVRDEIIGRLRGDDRDKGPQSQGGVALLHELKRLRDQQSLEKGTSKSANEENRFSRSVNGPLTLLNSIRRCASFAERVKSFENKLGSFDQHNQDSTSTPRTPIDNVKNLPQFATLQELFVNGSNTIEKDRVDKTKKVKMTVTKLSKDDWNVKCWENRLSVYRADKTLGGSTKSLRKAFSVDTTSQLSAATLNGSGSLKPRRQVEVFQGRIKEMADKLQNGKENKHKLYGELEKSSIKHSIDSQSNGRPQGSWVSHLQSELVRGSQYKGSLTKQPINRTTSKPIGKLFDNDDDDDDNQHCDHLCINRPTNKYLPKNGYKSHLVRTKYDIQTAKATTKTQPASATRQAYIAHLNSRGSSTASSTFSDYSTANTSLSSGNEYVKCFRCSRVAEPSTRIAIGKVNLHKACLSCAQCGIGLRTHELSYYLNRVDYDSQEGESQRFVCTVCKQHNESKESGSNGELRVSGDQQMKSREEFLGARINYNDIYKNIVSENAASNGLSEKIQRLGGSSTRSGDNEPSRGAHRESRAGSSCDLTEVTLPLQIIVDQRQPATDESDARKFRVARSESIDGSEQVTLVLPSNPSSTLNERASFTTRPREMIDEDELERLLHLARPTTSSIAPTDSSQMEELTKGESSDETSGEDLAEEEIQRVNDELSDDPSSLNSPPNTENYDNDSSEEIDENSTYGDLATSEEFDDASSGKED